MRTIRTRLYGVCLVAAVSAVSGLCVQGCDSDSDGGGNAVGAPIVLSVTSISPLDFATGVPTTSEVRVVFNRPVNPASLGGGSFDLRNAAGPVAGTLTYDAATRSATFVPTNLLVIQTQYSLTLNSSITSAVGGASLGTLISDFTTGNAADTTPPTFVGVLTAIPQSAVAALVSWNTASDDINPTGQIAYRIYRATTFGAQDFAAPVGLTGPGATAFYDDGLTATTQYFYVVRAVDSSGNEEANTTESTVTTNVPVSWSAEVFPLLDLPGAQNCGQSGCHGTSPQGGLTLFPMATAYSEIVGVVSNADGGCSPLERVAPGAPDDSHLFQKLAGTSTCGSIMPRDAAPLNSTQLDLLGDWIAEGALNN